MVDDRWSIVGVATLAPLTAALSLCSLLAFHSHRHRWRTLDLFLATLSAQELLVACLHFVRAIASLASTSSAGGITSSTGGGATCPLLVWTSLTLRTFQVTTLTSSVLERSLALRWPYNRRFRRSQVCYHIVVLAIISILVGVASIFAKRESPSSDDDRMTEDDVDQPCFQMPMFLDKKFVVFVVFLHGLLTLISLVGVVHVTAKLSVGRLHRSTSSGASAFQSISPSLRGVDHVRLPVPPPASSSGMAVTFQHRAAAPPPLPSAMQCLSASDVVWSSPILRASCSSLRRSGASSTSVHARLVRRDFRWKTVVSVVLTCNLVNHLPYLVMVVVGRWFDSIIEIPASYLDGAATYLALLEGLLLPVVLWVVDPTYRAAVTNSFIRISRTGKSATTTYFGSDRLEADNLSGLESLSCSTLPRRDVDLPPSVVSTYSSSANGFACNSTLDKKVLLTDIVPRRWSSTPDEFDRSPSTTITVKDLGTTMSVNLPKYSTSGLKVGAETYDYDEKMKFITKITKEQSEEHIYATLVNRLSMASDTEVIAKAAAAGTTTDDDEPEMDDNMADGDDEEEDDDDDDDDCSSFTTSASDDFEFHLTRPACPPQPNPQLPSRAPAPDVTDRFMSRPSLHDIVWEEAINDSPSRTSTMSIGSKTLQELPSSEYTTPAPSAVTGPRCLHSLSKNRKRASLSMNDLDLLELPEEEREAATEEIVYMLSGKSESTITLYRLRHAGVDANEHTLDRPLLKRRGTEKLMHNGRDVGHRHHHCSANVSSRSHATLSPKRQYLRNPLLLRGRFTNRPRAPPAACNGSGIYGNNWKYRPTVLPRQDFPWRKSPTQPFQAPQMPLSSARNFKSSSSTAVNVDAHHPPPYRKTFISEFL